MIYISVCICHVCKEIFNLKPALTKMSVDKSVPPIEYFFKKNYENQVNDKF